MPAFLYATIVVILGLAFHPSAHGEGKLQPLPGTPYFLLQEEGRSADKSQWFKSISSLFRGSNGNGDGNSDGNSNGRGTLDYKKGIYFKNGKGPQRVADLPLIVNDQPVILAPLERLNHYDGFQPYLMVNENRQLQIFNSRSNPNDPEKPALLMGTQDNPIVLKELSGRTVKLALPPIFYDVTILCHPMVEGEMVIVSIRTQPQGSSFQDKNGLTFAVLLKPEIDNIPMSFNSVPVLLDERYYERTTLTRLLRADPSQPDQMELISPLLAYNLSNSLKEDGFLNRAVREFLNKPFEAHNPGDRAMLPAFSVLLPTESIHPNDNEKSTGDFKPIIPKILLPVHIESLASRSLNLFEGLTSYGQEVVLITFDFMGQQVSHLMAGSLKRTTVGTPLVYADRENLFLVTNKSVYFVDLKSPKLDPVLLNTLPENRSGQSILDFVFQSDQVQEAKALAKTSDLKLKLHYEGNNDPVQVSYRVRRKGAYSTVEPLVGVSGKTSSWKLDPNSPALEERLDQSVLEMYSAPLASLLKKIAQGKVTGNIALMVDFEMSKAVTQMLVQMWHDSKLSPDNQDWSIGNPNLELHLFDGADLKNNVDSMKEKSGKKTQVLIVDVGRLYATSLLSNDEKLGALESRSIDARNGGIVSLRKQTDLPATPLYFLATNGDVPNTPDQLKEWNSMVNTYQLGPVKIFITPKEKESHFRLLAPPAFEVTQMFKKYVMEAPDFEQKVHYVQKILESSGRKADLDIPIVTQEKWTQAAQLRFAAEYLVASLDERIKRDATSPIVALNLFVVNLASMLNQSSSIDMKMILEIVTLSNRASPTDFRSYEPNHPLRLLHDEGFRNDIIAQIGEPQKALRLFNALGSQNEYASTGRAVPTVLLLGPPGVGKSRMLGLLQNKLKTEKHFLYLSGADIRPTNSNAESEPLSSFLTNMNGFGILVYDEAHLGRGSQPNESTARQFFENHILPLIQRDTTPYKGLRVVLAANYADGDSYYYSSSRGDPKEMALRALGVGQYKGLSDRLTEIIQFEGPQIDESGISSLTSELAREIFDNYQRVLVMSPGLKRRLVTSGGGGSSSIRDLKAFAIKSIGSSAQKTQAPLTFLTTDGQAIPVMADPKTPQEFRGNMLLAHLMANSYRSMVFKELIHSILNLDNQKWWNQNHSNDESLNVMKENFPNWTNLLFSDIELRANRKEFHQQNTLTALLEPLGSHLRQNPLLSLRQFKDYQRASQFGFQNETQQSQFEEIIGSIDELPNQNFGVPIAESVNIHDGKLRHGVLSRFYHELKTLLNDDLKKRMGVGMDWNEMNDPKQFLQMFESQRLHQETFGDRLLEKFVEFKAALFNEDLEEMKSKSFKSLRLQTMIFSYLVALEHALGDLPWHQVQKPAAEALLAIVSSSSVFRFDPRLRDFFQTDNLFKNLTGASLANFVSTSLTTRFEVEKTISPSGPQPALKSAMDQEVWVKNFNEAFAPLGEEFEAQSGLRSNTASTCSTTVL